MKMILKKISYNLILFLVIAMMSKSCGIFTDVSTPVEPKSEAIERLLSQSNRQYVEILQQDGWPTEKLNTGVNADYLSDIEKNMILAHNLIRFDPEKYANLYVTEYFDYYQGKEFHYPGLDMIMLTQEGIMPARELYRELQRSEPLPLLIPSQKLSKAARSHAQDQSQTGRTGHGGQGGMRARIEREGEWEHTIGENIAYGNWSGHNATLGLMIDDGVPDRGHRINILNENFKVLGVAHSSHPKFEGGVYVIKYAGGFEDVETDI